MKITTDEIQAEHARLAAQHEKPLSGPELEARAKERREQVLALVEQGKGFKAIARMLGVHKRSIQRDFQALRAQGKLKVVDGRYVVVPKKCAKKT